MGRLDCSSICGSLTVMAAVVVSVVSAGCVYEEPHRPEYLQGEQRLVGGGLRIHWQAPEEGTVYLVEKRTDKLVETRSLIKGEAYAFAVEGVVDARDMEDLLGIDIADAEFLLYFEPASTESGTP